MSRLFGKYLNLRATSSFIACLLGVGFIATNAQAITVAIPTASTYEVGLLTTTPYTNSVALPYNSYIPNDDTYNFSVSSTSPIFLGVSNVYGVSDVYGYLVMNLYDSSNNLLSSGLSFSGNLAAGSYHAVISSVVSVATGGGYTFTAGAVPEPETWGMIAVGIGMIGFQIRRRKNKQSVPSELI